MAQEGLPASLELVEKQELSDQMGAVDPVDLLDQLVRRVL